MARQATLSKEPPIPTPSTVRTSKGFLAELESIDPSENYKGTSLEGLDAFERQLKRFDIKVSGNMSKMCIRDRFDTVLLILKLMVSAIANISGALKKIRSIIIYIFLSLIHISPP